MDNITRREVAFELIRLSDELTSQSRATRKNKQLSEARLSIIHFLIESGPQTLKSLADYRKVSAATMSKLVDAIVKEGWVLRANSRHDKRSKIFIVTRKGKTLADNENEQDLTTLTKIIEQLNPDEQANLSQAIQLIKKVTNLSAKVPV